MKLRTPTRALYCRFCNVCEMIDPCVDLPPVGIPCTKWTC